MKEWSPPHDRAPLTIRGAALLIVAVACSIPCAAQTLLWSRSNPNYGGNLGDLATFGQFVWPIGDCNADGVTDVLVSDGTAPHGYAHAGYVGILSGADGSTIRDWHGGSSGAHLYSYGPVGDADGDGAGDFTMQQNDPANGQQPSSSLVSGATGQPIVTWPNSGSSPVWPAGDVNQDGFGDFASTGYIVSAGSNGFIVLAGPVGAAVLQTQTLAPLQTMLGNPVVLIDDLDGDGVDDLFAGAPGGWCSTPYPSGPPLVGQAFAYSGATGSLLRQFTGVSPCDYFGRALAAPGDLDGDGVTELIIGAPGAGQYFVYSGGDGTLLSVHPYAGCPNGQCGMPMASLGDVNADGFGDYAITNHPATTLKVYSGSDHSILATISAPPVATHFIGWALCPVGDVSGDGAPDLACGEPCTSWSGVPVPIGRIRCYSLGPVGTAIKGGGCSAPGASIPRIGVDHAAVSGSPFTINLSQVSPNQGYMLILGLSNTMFGSLQLPWNLTGLGLPGCQLYTSMDSLVLGVTAQVGAASGASFTTPIPATYGTGARFHAQWAVDNPAGSTPAIRMSRGLTVTIQ